MHEEHTELKRGPVGDTTRRSSTWPPRIGVSESCASAPRSGIEVATQGRSRREDCAGLQRSTRIAIRNDSLPIPLPTARISPVLCRSQPRPKQTIPGFGAAPLSAKFPTNKKQRRSLDAFVALRLGLGAVRVPWICTSAGTKQLQDAPVRVEFSGQGHQ
jgi:hypothetical protein